MGICRHCERVMTIRALGLCRRCYGKVASKYREQTLADLDAMIAEQMLNLPEWWNQESRCRPRPKTKRWSVPVAKTKYRRNGRRVH